MSDNPVRAFVVVEIRGPLKVVADYSEALRTAIEGDVLFLDLIWRMKHKAPQTTIHDVKVEEESVQT